VIWSAAAPAATEESSQAEKIPRVFKFWQLQIMAILAIAGVMSLSVIPLILGYCHAEGREDMIPAS